MTQEKIQVLLLGLIPVWNYKITKPFKQLLEDGVSLEMYCCIKTLQWAGGILSMSKLAEYTNTPKDQMTKMSNRLVKQELVERVYDASDRRIIRLKLTEKGIDYVDNYITRSAECFQPALEQLSSQDLEKFGQALEALTEILYKPFIETNNQ